MEERERRWRQGKRPPVPKRKQSIKVKRLHPPVFIQSEKIHHRRGRVFLQSLGENRAPTFGTSGKYGVNLRYSAPARGD
jgi:hypothetical protein